MWMETMATKVHPSIFFCFIKGQLKGFSEKAYSTGPSDLMFLIDFILFNKKKSLIYFIIIKPCSKTISCFTPSNLSLFNSWSCLVIGPSVSARGRSLGASSARHAPIGRFRAGHFLPPSSPSSLSRSCRSRSRLISFSSCRYFLSMKRF